ncbi:M4 family metallopeptidase [Nocardioides sp. L-11A]|uniref:M4 family metallopeptidase n=1 Tax=Nocardioides sp. L-11A TaxID=3043848 RepID=UPI00249CC583|nr:M4 family metallopeptidase [Nocardioides sp. L-11A]
MRLNLPDALRKGVGLSLVGAALVVIPSAPVTAAPNDPSVVQQMRGEASGDVAVTMSPATDRLGFISATKDLYPSERSGTTRSGAQSKADAYVAKYARAFGASAAELEQSAVSKTEAGYTVDFAQRHQGVPVFGAKLRAQVDLDGDLVSVSGYVAPKVDVDVTPRIDEASAEAKAIKLAAQAPAGAEEDAAVKPKASTLTAEATLMVYRMGAIQGIEGRNLLAWVVEVTDGKQTRETSVLDAITGKPVNRYSMIAHALDRELHEQSIENEPVWVEADAPDWPEGTGGATLTQDQQNEVQGTGEAYWLFMNSFGRDSWDGAGGKMITVNNDPTIQCPNANWNGRSTNYCTGVSSDDTVAHEWGHAYTEKTSGLLYQWQPGAMNEAYSDIWGETVDMLNDRFNAPDEETPRTDGKCSEGTRGDITVVVTPEAQVGECTAVAASFGPIIDDVTDDLVVGTDAVEEEEGEVVGTDTDGCSPFDNDTEIAGKFVYVDRGLCPFADKIAHAEDADAVGIVFGNNQPGVASVAGFSSLYGAMVTQADGAEIKAAAGPLSITLTDAEVPGSRDASFRWLSGEDDPAFGGAIRDMWNPNCYGDPGKVSDEEYFCDTDDSGGVHTNSGVVNHTFALLVDGGTFNGVTVPGIGLDKAAHLFWRTQSAYLTPTSGFAELADGLEASCAILTGNTALKKLTLGNSATGGSAADEGTIAPIAAADCAAVTQAIAATELRKEPVQCNFKPMFHAGRAGCGDDTVTKDLWTEGFESGIPAGWTQDVEYADFGPDGHGSKHFDATTTRDLPVVSKGGMQHKGGTSVLYFDDKGDAGNFGSCNLDEDDYSSRVGMSTPVLTVPEGALPRLSFDHYVATEVSFDGGNVKVKVNGAPEFELVPDRAWLYNAPGGELDSVAAGNTNPMAGEPAFTGADGGLPTGQWGYSAIDLSMIAKPGDTVQFRFDFGMDGCNGNDGWYIDNVALSVCTAPVPPAPGTATVAPKASAKKGIVTIKINTAGGVMPSGPVTVAIKGRTYTGTVVNGVLKVKAKKQLKKLWRQGKRKVKATVSYPGDARIAPFSGKVTIKLKGKQ